MKGDLYKIDVRVDPCIAWDSGVAEVSFSARLTPEELVAFNAFTAQVRDWHNREFLRVYGSRPVIHGGRVPRIADLSIRVNRMEQTVVDAKTLTETLTEFFENAISFPKNPQSQETSHDLAVNRIFY